LAHELGTSEDTIRRDLRELAQGGKLQRVHGGALPASAAVGDLKVREQVSPNDKIELGRAGASMIRPKQVVILDGGTTASVCGHHHAGRSVVSALHGECRCRPHRRRLAPACGFVAAMEDTTRTA
jgi:DeoR/GlpR family transcriptional regulator of sugar metabolism